MDEFTFKETNLRIFQKLPYPGVFFQPRVEPWLDWMRRHGTAPDQIAGMSVREFYDSRGLSMRYMQYYTDQPSPVSMAYDPVVREVTVPTPRGQTTTLSTPHGPLVFDEVRVEEGGYRILGHPVRSPGDFRKLEWLCAHTHWSFSPEAFEQGAAWLGDLGQPQFFLPKSPYQALSQYWMHFEDFVAAILEYPDEVESVMRAIDSSYDALFEQVARHGKTRIVNFGENLHGRILVPGAMEEHLMPWYERRVGQLRRAGIFSHAHLDGDLRPLLPHLRYLPFEGLEALTPAPQGDVTLEELKEAMGDKILLDGIPAILFMGHHPREQLMECVERLVGLFWPHLVLGISDEIPMAADEEGLWRLEWVVRWCEKSRKTR